jgi:hypothetical protein
LTTANGAFTAFRGPVDRQVFAPGFGIWIRVEAPVRKVRRVIVTLPDRGLNAEALPPEFFRFPHF